MVGRVREAGGLGRLILKKFENFFDKVLPPPYYRILASDMLAFTSHGSHLVSYTVSAVCKDSSSGRKCKTRCVQQPWVCID